MKKPLTTLLLIPALLAPYPLRAMAAPLTWEDCVRQASQTNPDLKAAGATLEQSKQQKNAAYSPFLPSLSANASYSRSGNGGGLLSGTGGSNGTTTSGQAFSNGDNYAASLSITQNLFNGGADQAKLRQAKATESASAASLDAVRAKVSLDLKTAFANLWFSRRSTKLSEDITTRRQRNLELVQLRFEGGRENKGSLLLSQAYLNQARLERTQASNGVATASSQLARAMGLPGSPELDIAGDLPVHAPPPEVDFVALAEQSPEARQAYFTEAGAEAAVGAARGALMPSLNLTGSVGRSGDRWFPENDRWSATVNLSVPIFSGGKDYFALQAARAAQTTASYNRSIAREQQIVKLRQAYAAYVEAVEREKVDKSFMDAAKTRAEIARNKYNNGLLSFDEWDIIENDLITREKAYLQTQRDRAIAEATWEQSQGKGELL